MSMYELERLNMNFISLNLTLNFKQRFVNLTSDLFDKVSQKGH